MSIARDIVMIEKTIPSGLVGIEPESWRVNEQNPDGSGSDTWVLIQCLRSTKPGSLALVRRDKPAIAQLIAAAPELFTFAKEMRGYLDLKLSQFRQDYPENHCIVDTAKRYLAQCDAVIAKVERGIK